MPHTYRTGTGMTVINEFQVNRYRYLKFGIFIEQFLHKLNKPVPVPILLVIHVGPKKIEVKMLDGL
jgi:hypothetical protein